MMFFLGVLLGFIVGSVWVAYMYERYLPGK